MIAHTLSNTSVAFDLNAFSRLSKADKAKVMEAKIKLIANGNATGVDPTLASFAQRAFQTVLEVGPNGSNVLAPTALVPTIGGALGPILLSPYHIHTAIHLYSVEVFLNKKTHVFTLSISLSSHCLRSLLLQER